MTAVYFCFTVRNSAQAHRLKTDRDQATLGRRNRVDTITSEELSLKLPDGGRRKLECMAAVHQREGREDAKPAKVAVSAKIQAQSQQRAKK